jgi:hypothetical protein
MILEVVGMNMHPLPDQPIVDMDSEFSGLMTRTGQNDLLSALEKIASGAERHMRRAAFAWADIKTLPQRESFLGELSEIDGADYRIEEGYLPQRVLANYIGALDHIYLVIGSLQQHALDFNIGTHGLGGEHGRRLERMLHQLDDIAHRIFSLEPRLIKDFGQGLHFYRDMPDYSFKEHSHWKNMGFGDYFMRQRGHIASALQTNIPAESITVEPLVLGDYIHQRYRNLDAAITRLGPKR